MAVKWMPLSEFKRIYRKVPRLCVDAAIVTKDGILLVKRDITPAKGMWHLPGGTVLIGESNTDALSRIAKSEVGLDVKADNFIGLIEYSPEYAYGQTTGLVYTVKVLGGKARGSKAGKEVGYFKSIPENTLPDQAEFIKNHRALIKEIRS
jgi:ADP-ribose pyrophosphatase YjhB (NUDIX family)